MEDYSQDMIQKIGIKTIFKTTISIFVIIMIGCVSLYFFQFHDGLSIKGADWANFATFITAIPMCFLSFINIILFYALTTSIESNNAHRQKISNELSQKQFEIEIQQHDRHFKYSRQEETISAFMTSISKCYIQQQVGNVLDNSYVQSAILRLKSMENQIDLFPIMPIDNMHTLINQLHTLSIYHQGFSNFDSVRKEINNIYNSISNLTIEIVKVLRSNEE